MVIVMMCLYYKSMSELVSHAVWRIHMHWFSPSPPFPSAARTPILPPLKKVFAVIEAQREEEAAMGDLPLEHLLQPVYVPEEIVPPPEINEVDPDAALRQAQLVGEAPMMPPLERVPSYGSRRSMLDSFGGAWVVLGDGGGGVAGTGVCMAWCAAVHLLLEFAVAARWCWLVACQTRVRACTHGHAPCTFCKQEARALPRTRARAQAPGAEWPEWPCPPSSTTSQSRCSASWSC